MAARSIDSMSLLIDAAAAVDIGISSAIAAASGPVSGMAGASSERA